MSTVAFDTLKFAQTLRDKAKLSSEQAEGIVEAFAAATTEQLATKADIAMLEARMDTRFKEVQLVIGSMIVGLGGILVAIKFLGH